MGRRPGYPFPWLRPDRYSPVQSFPVVFQVSHNEQIPSAWSTRHQHAGLIGLGQNVQIRNGEDILAPDFRMPGMRSIENVVEPPEQAAGRVVQPMVNTPEILRSS